MKQWKTISIFLVIVVVLAGMFYWQKGQTAVVGPQEKKLIPMNFVLDWTPNTNHTGVYVALGKGWYKEEGIDLKILPYSSGVSSSVLLTSGKADVGVGFTEGVVADAATGNPVISIAAIMQHNTSGFMALADSGIARPRDLDGKISGSASPLEKAVAGAIIRKDGGKGEYSGASLDVSAMQALESKKIDFFWVFEGVEVVQAKHEGKKVVYFPSLEYGIPDYYTPVLVASPGMIKEKPELLKKFMRATAKGYTYAIAHPKEAAQMLIDGTQKGTFPDKGFVFASQEFASKHYVDSGRKWGLQDREAWHEYPQFMIDNGAALDKNGNPVKSLNFDSLYTNEFLE